MEIKYMKKSTSIFRVLSLQLVVFLLTAALFATGYYFRKDILIKYHISGQKSALQAMQRYSANPSTHAKVMLYQEKYQGHNNALIKLGYLAERTFSTKYLTLSGSEMKKATDEFLQIQPGSSYSIGGTGGLEIRITCRSDLMPAWEELIKKYDIPPEDPNMTGAPVDSAK